MIRSDAYKTIFVEGIKVYIGWILSKIPSLIFLVLQYGFSFHLMWFGILVSFEFSTSNLNIT